MRLDVTLWGKLRVSTLSPLASFDIGSIAFQSRFLVTDPYAWLYFHFKHYRTHLLLSGTYIPYILSRSFPRTCLDVLVLPIVLPLDVGRWTWSIRLSEIVFSSLF